LKTDTQSIESLIAIVSFELSHGEIIQKKDKKINVNFLNKNYSTDTEGKTDPEKPDTGQDSWIPRGINPGRTQEYVPRNTYPGIRTQEYVPRNTYPGLVTYHTTITTQLTLIMKRISSSKRQVKPQRGLPSLSDHQTLVQSEWSDYIRTIQKPGCALI
jgi:hypothetical protein